MIIYQVVDSLTWNVIAEFDNEEQARHYADSRIRWIMVKKEI